MTRRSLAPCCFLAALVLSCSSSDGGESAAFQGERAWSFAELAPDAVPDGWLVQATNPGPYAAVWGVVTDPEAGAVLALTDPRGATGQTYNLCWTDELAFQDGAVEVDVRAGAGVEDQGGGPAWRIRDADNYYLARWNPLENNFRVYSVRDGRRVQLASAELDVDPDAWHTIRIEHFGANLRCLFDGTLYLTVSDTTHPLPGGVGLWTKADAATSFDAPRVSNL